MKEKIIEFKNNVTNKLYSTIEWAEDHPVAAAAIVSACGTIIGKSINLASKGVSYRRAYKLDRMKDLRVYDPSNGVYYHLKKPMSNKQRLDLDKLKSRGVTTGAALYYMGVLK